MQFCMHISHDFVESIFVAIYGVSESRRERAAVTLFFSVLVERNTLPLTGAWGGWVVAGLGGGWLAGWLVGWLAGCWVWIIGFDNIVQYSISRTRIRLRPSFFTCGRDESGWCSDVTSTHGAWRHAGVRIPVPELPGITIHHQTERDHAKNRQHLRWWCKKNHQTERSDAL